MGRYQFRNSPAWYQEEILRSPGQLYCLKQFLREEYPVIPDTTPSRPRSLTSSSHLKFTDIRRSELTAVNQSEPLLDPVWDHLVF